MYDDAGSDDGTCPCCNRLVQPTGAQRIGRGCAMVIVLLVGVIACAPLLWAARVCAEWAMGIS